MNFFGKFTLREYTDTDGSCVDNLWRVHNPVGPDMWGVDMGNGRRIIPCDDFATDLSSSLIARGIYPATTGKKAAVIHDWLRHCHVVTHEELFIELEAWFDSMGWTFDQRIEYINWLKSFSYSEWNNLYYDLSILQGVNRFKARLALWVLYSVSWIPWNSGPTNKTRDYRLTNNRGDCA